MEEGKERSQMEGECTRSNEFSILFCFVIFMFSIIKSQDLKKEKSTLEEENEKLKSELKEIKKKEMSY